MGGDAVERALATGPVISAVNYGEVLSRLSDAGEDAGEADRRLRDQGLIGGLLSVELLTHEDAVTIGRMRSATRPLGLSLGDRACLALGLRLGLAVLTADRAWAGVAAGVRVDLIR